MDGLAAAWARTAATSMMAAVRKSRFRDRSAVGDTPRLYYHYLQTLPPLTPQITFVEPKLAPARVRIAILNGAGFVRRASDIEPDPEVA